jgi:hypothetical protein
MSPTDGSTNEIVDYNFTNSPTGSANTAQGVNIFFLDSTSLANTVNSFIGTVSLTGNAAKTGIGINSVVASSSTVGDTLRGYQSTISATGALAAAQTRTIMGFYGSPASTGATAASDATLNLYGGYFAPSSTLATDGTTNVFGLSLTSTATHAADAGTINQYGLYVANGTSGTNGTSTKYGIYIESQTGADTNYALYTAGGRSVFNSASNATTGYINLTSAGNYAGTSGTQYAFIATPVQTATTTGGLVGSYGRVDTSAAAITLGSAYNFYSANPSKGAGSTITTAYGLYLENITSGSTNYAIYSLGGQSYFAGNVGIGTTASLAPLQVNTGTSGTQAIFGTTNPVVIEQNWPSVKFNYYNNGGGNTVYTTGYSGEIALRASSGIMSFNLAASQTAGLTPTVNTYMIINQSGNVGIGEYSDIARLAVGLGSGTATNRGIYVAQSGAKTAADYGVYIANTSTSSTNSINKYGTYITSTGTWNGTSANNYGLYVDTVSGGTNNYSAYFAGNVGIGATSPSTILEVRQDTSGTELLTLRNDSTGGMGIAFNEGSTITSLIKHDISSNALSFYTNADTTTAKAVLTSGGNFGIGDASPASLLTVGNGDLFQVNSSGAIAAVTG